MKYCINRRHSRQNINERLTNTGNWRNCTEPFKLLTEDWATDNPNQIANHKQENPLTDSDQGMDYRKGKLYYEVYCFRDEWPDLPVVLQLARVLRKGDDDKWNKLVLKTDGQYYLLEGDDEIEEDDPAIVVHYASFAPGNQYVGGEFESESSENYKEYINGLQAQGLQCWLTHLKDKITGIPAEETEAEIDELEIEIENFKEVWSPDY